MTSINPDFQRKCSDFVSREVHHCVSTLVYEISQKVEHFPEYEDELYSAFESEPDYEEAASENNWQQAADGTIYRVDNPQYYLSVNLDERGLLAVSVDRLIAPEQRGETIWSFDGTADEAVELDGSDTFDPRNPDQLGDYLIECKIIEADADLSTDEDGNFEVADDWEEACTIDAIDVDDYRREVFEHWAVSGWLADKLEAKGEKIIRNLFDFNAVWCRTTTGQAISMDRVIEEIVAELA